MCHLLKSQIFPGFYPAPAPISEQIHRDLWEFQRNQSLENPKTFLMIHGNPRCDHGPNSGCVTSSNPNYSQVFIFPGYYPAPAPISQQIQWDLSEFQRNQDLENPKTSSMIRGNPSAAPISQQIQWDLSEFQRNQGSENTKTFLMIRGNPRCDRGPNLDVSPPQIPDIPGFLSRSSSNFSADPASEFQRNQSLENPKTSSTIPGHP
ncbi:hypothetical protein HGM15179_020844, partial [Zosterops borbonicus]